VIRVLITGGSGFLGSNLKKYFTNEEQLELSFLRRKNNSTDSFSEWDLNDISLDKIDIIVHLAGKAHDLNGYANSLEYYQGNFQMTKNLYDLFLGSKVEKFIFISSVKAVADSIDKKLTEEQVPMPKTDYGKSKLMAENYIREQPLSSGKYFYILRPCMIHGPGNKGNLNLLYWMISIGIPYPFGAFSNKKSFLSVVNFCFITKELITREGIPSGVYNLADYETLSTNQVILEIGKVLGMKPRFWNLNKKVIIKLVKVADFFHLPYLSSTFKKLTENYEVSNSKIVNTLQIELPVSALDGIRNTILSFKEIG
jgi:nucleoside-diphosphate-sugar epimerase